MNKSVPLEIEHKFLIRMPEAALLSANAEGFAKISQTYLGLGPSGQGRRVRMLEKDGRTAYYYTEKKTLSDLTREEAEHLISRDKYLELLTEADPQRSTVSKTRWYIPSGPHTFELDIFPFWDDRALLEVEVSSEEEQFEIPRWLDIIKEVSGDPRYSNAAIAKSPVREDI